MCGRFMLKTSIDEIADLFGVGAAQSARPRYNIAPSQDAVIVWRSDQGERILDRAQFGFVPSWADDPKFAYKMINARGETVDQLPSFREAYRQRRCLIPADGFFEWQSVNPSRQGPKQPYVIRRPDEKPFAFAGIHDHWQSPSGARRIHSFAIITTRANNTLRSLHARMPVVLAQEAYHDWLDPSDDPRPLIKPCPDHWLTATMIGLRINRPAHDDASVLEPVDCPVMPRQQSLF